MRAKLAQPLVEVCIDCAKLNLSYASVVRPASLSAGQIRPDAENLLMSSGIRSVWRHR